MGFNERLTERRLPVGVTEFEQLATDLRTEYADELPAIDDASLKFVLSSTIMHLGPLDSHKSLDFFYKTVVAGAAKQVAHFVFRDVKLKQEAEIKAAEQEAAKKAAEESTSNAEAVKS